MVKTWQIFLGIWGFFSPNLTSPAISICERQLLEAIIFQWSCNVVQVRDRWIADDPPEARRSHSHSHSCLHRSGRWYSWVHPSSKVVGYFSDYSIYLWGRGLCPVPNWLVDISKVIGEYFTAGGRGLHSWAQRLTLAPGQQWVLSGGNIYPDISDTFPGPMEACTWSQVDFQEQLLEFSNFQAFCPHPQ